MKTKTPLFCLLSFIFYLYSSSRLTTHDSRLTTHDSRLTTHIADYNCPIPRGFSRSIAYGIERITKGDHHKNFMNYMSRGGIGWFTDVAGMTIKSTWVKGNGVFIVVVCN